MSFVLVVRVYSWGEGKVWVDAQPALVEMSESGSMGYSSYFRLDKGKDGEGRMGNRASGRIIVDALNGLKVSRRVSVETGKADGQSGLQCNLDPVFNFDYGLDSIGRSTRHTIQQYKSILKAMKARFAGRMCAATGFVSVVDELKVLCDVLGIEAVHMKPSTFDQDSGQNFAGLWDGVKWSTVVRGLDSEGITPWDEIETTLNVALKMSRPDSWGIDEDLNNPQVSATLAAAGGAE